jgi:hypothetical protein
MLTDTLSCRLFSVYCSVGLTVVFDISGVYWDTGPLLGYPSPPRLRFKSSEFPFPLQYDRIPKISAKSPLQTEMDTPTNS